MKRKWTVTIAIALVAVFAMVMVAQAESVDDLREKRKELRKQERELRREEGKLRKNEVRDRIELMMMWRLTDALDLDQETAAKLFPMMHKANDAHMALKEKRRGALDQMRDEIEKDAPDSATLRSLIKEFKQNERDIVEMRIKKLDDLSQLLSDEQIAKVIALVPRFERDVKGLIREGRELRKERRRARQGAAGN